MKEKDEIKSIREKAEGTKWSLEVPVSYNFIADNRGSCFSKLCFLLHIFLACIWRQFKASILMEKVQDSRNKEYKVCSLALGQHRGMTEVVT